MISNTALIFYVDEFLDADDSQDTDDEDSLSSVSKSSRSRSAELGRPSPPTVYTEKEGNTPGVVEAADDDPWATPVKKSPKWKKPIY